MLTRIGFADRFSISKMDGLQVLKMDGLQEPENLFIQMQDATDVLAYRNRHNCLGLVVLASCHAKCRLTMFSCKSSGSSNDTTYNSV
jgi:hypothetical protein